MRAAVLLALLALPALASEPIAPKIHSYGFPLAVAGGEVDELLRRISRALQNLDPLTASSLEELADCNTLECVLQDPKARELLERSLGEGGFSVEGLKGTSVDGLLDMIDDPQLREALSEAIKTGELSGKEAQEILEIISHSYKGGTLSTKGYMAALEAVRRIAERNMTLAKRIEVEQLQAIKRALLHSDIVRDVAKRLSETSPERPAFPAERSNFSMPSLDVPVAPLLLLIAVLLAAPLSLLLFRSPKIERRLKMAVASLSPAPEGAAKGGVVALYWEAVRLVEIVTGEKKEESATHREYLAGVRDHTVGEPFKEITYAYEQVRFGGRREEELKGSLSDRVEQIRRAG